MEAENAAKLEETREMREVPRVPEHCGRPMRRLFNASTGSSVYVCKCGEQVKGENVKGMEK